MNETLSYFVVAVILFISLYIYKNNWNGKKRYWKNKALKRRKSLDEEIGGIVVNLHDIMDIEKQVLLQKLSAVEILSKIQDGTFTSEQLVKYFSEMSRRAHKEYNCVAEVLLKDALQRAKELDNILATTKSPVGPLHGIPISIKECIPMKGTYGTAGYAQFLASRSTTDSVVVQVLKEAGAIPLVKTNVPQSLLIYETSNQIYGATTNPWNKLRTAGGSSGGESAILASGGTPLGIGSDIGGSARIPAHFTGIFGFKPTAKRISSKNGYIFDNGQRTVIPTVGPMGRSTQDMELIMRVLSERQYELDPTVPPLPWRYDLYTSNKKLRIGYYLMDDFFQISTACVRAVEEVVDSLKKRGHTIVQFTPPSIKQAVRLFLLAITADESINIKKKLNEEYVDTVLKKTYIKLNLPKFLVKIILFILDKIGHKRYAEMNGIIAQKKTVLELWKCQAEIDQYRQEFLENMNCDILIAPGGTSPAITHNTAQDALPLAYTTFIYNLLNLPVGCVPVTNVKKEDIKLRTSPKDMWDSIANTWDTNSVGLPISVQVVGLPWQDEVVLRVMKEIEEEFPFTNKIYESVREKILMGDKET